MILRCVNPGKFLLLALAFACGVACADEAGVRKLVASKFPGARIESVVRTPYGGLYEVYMDGNIFYTDGKMSYIIVGNLTDTRTGKNITLQRLRKLTAVDAGQIPLELGIKRVQGNGRRKLIVFSDPLCPFCQQLDQQLLKVNDVTIYVMLYPIEHLHPGATELSHQIWCSPDRARAWDDWMQGRKRPAAAAAACIGDPIVRIDGVGDKLGINTAPTLVFADGGVIAGVVDATQIEKYLADTPPSN
ncbi:MAG TPA: DsbC family protein [Burkholderiales bacterium]|nr:DsbC family protein [Burkholderiales bacterium]